MKTTTTIATTLGLGLLGMASAQQEQQEYVEHTLPLEEKKAADDGVQQFTTKNCPFDGQSNPVILKDGFSYLEGALWLGDEKSLLVSDVSADKIFSLKGGKEIVTEEWRGNSGFYSNGIALDNNGQVITTENRGIARINDDMNRIAGEIVADRVNGMTLNNPNDVVVDFEGNMFFTDPTYGGKGEVGKTGVYQIMAKSGEVKILEQYDEPAQPNGIALSPDQKKLYTVDGSDGVLREFTKNDATGLFTDVKVLTTVPVGGDGIVVDKLGMIYVTTGINQVIVYNAMGEQCENVLQFDEPATSLAFGGQNMKALYITTQHKVAKVGINNFGFIPALTKPITAKEMKKSMNLKGSGKKGWTGKGKGKGRGKKVKMAEEEEEEEVTMPILEEEEVEVVEEKDMPILEEVEAVEEKDMPILEEEEVEVVEEKDMPILEEEEEEVEAVEEKDMPILEEEVEAVEEEEAVDFEERDFVPKDEKDLVKIPIPAQEPAVEEKEVELDAEDLREVDAEDLEEHDPTSADFNF